MSIVTSITVLLVMQNGECQKVGAECEDQTMRALAMGLLLSATTWMFIAMR